MPAPTKKSPAKPASRAKRGAGSKAPGKTQSKAAAPEAVAAVESKHSFEPPARSGSKSVPAVPSTTGAETRPRSLAPEERRRMIAEAAFLRAEQRGFRGDPMQDWLDAESEVDARLLRRDGGTE